jgi:endoglucanase
MMAHAAANPKFKWQRKLMAGGACEATAFSAFGFHSTCLCLPLGNYHNMQAIDEVQAGRRPAKVGREYISVEDLHGLVEMLEVVANGLDAPDKATPLPERLRTLRRKHEIVLNG